MLTKKRAQMAETMTWIVATLIIIGVLLIFIYASSLLAKTTKIIDFKGSLFSKYEKDEDLLMEKSVFAFFLIKEPSEKEKIYDKLINDDKNGKFYKDLEPKIKEIELNLENVKND